MAMIADKIRRTLARGLAVGLMASALALPAQAAPTKAELLQLAATGAAICAQSMPDEKATAAALKANGFRFIEANGTLKAYLGASNRVAVLLTSSSSRATACMVAVSKMTEAEALALIKPWLEASGAKPIAPRADLEHAWAGNFKGGPVELAVETSADLMYFRGAAILARAAR